MQVYRNPPLTNCISPDELLWVVTGGMYSVRHDPFARSERERHLPPHSRGRRQPDLAVARSRFAESTCARCLGSARVQLDEEGATITCDTCGSSLRPLLSVIEIEEASLPQSENDRRTFWSALRQAPRLLLRALRRSLSVFMRQFHHPR